MPAAMHSFYLRTMYQQNKLCQPGGIALDGTPIDLRQVKTPCFILSAKEDHIAPWKSTYAATQLYSGPVKFVLAASGHIAGVINPPAKSKYGHWVNENSPPYPSSPDDWFKTATARDGSWWPDWNEWVSQYSGGEVEARQPGTGKLPALADAPGTYVLVRSGE
jgi:polyhydroxyalkanoate synthase